MTYTYLLSNFPFGKVNLNRLTQEISNSSITISLSSMDSYGTVVNINFKADLSIDEKSTLDTIVANHSGESLPDEIVIQQVKVVAEQPKYIEAGNPTQELFAAESVIIDISTGELLKIVRSN